MRCLKIRKHLRQDREGAIFLFMQVRSIIDYIFSPCNPL